MIFFSPTSLTRMCSGQRIPQILSRFPTNMLTAGWWLVHMIVQVKLNEAFAHWCAQLSERHTSISVTHVHFFATENQWTSKMGQSISRLDVYLPVPLCVSMFCTNTEFKIPLLSSRTRQVLNSFHFPFLESLLSSWLPAAKPVHASARGLVRNFPVIWKCFCQLHAGISKCHWCHSLIPLHFHFRLQERLQRHQGKM